MEREENMEVDESDGDEDLSDDDSENEDEAGKQEALTKCIQQVEGNPYNYSAHVSLTNQARKCQDLAVLRKARQHMSELFPLTEELWKSWIDDEVTILDRSAPGELERIKALYERSVQDYLAVDLWLDYAMFCMDDLSSEEALQPVRDIFERSVAAAGLHVVKGTVLWSAYREVEQGYLDLLSSQNPLDAEKIKNQNSRVVRLFKRQFSVPLLGMDEAYEEYSVYAATNPDHENIERLFKKSKQKLEKLTGFEKQLEDADVNGKYKIFMEYIDQELKAKERPHVRVLFERAVIPYCLYPDLWLRYLDFLDGTLKDEKLSLETHERAIRNVPWNSDLWMSYIRALELYGRDLKAVTGVFDRAIASGGCSSEETYVELNLAVLCYMRRHLNSGCSSEELRQKCQEVALDMESKGMDAENRTKLFWAALEVECFGDMAKCREIMDAILKNHQQKGSFWMEYFHLERRFGDVASSRAILKKAMYRNLDDAGAVAQAWIQLECVSGTLADWLEAHRTCSASLKRIAERKAKDALVDEKPRARRGPPRDNKPVIDRKHRREDGSAKQNGQRTKRKDDAVVSPGTDNASSKSAKPSTDSDGFKVPALPTVRFQKKQKVETPAEAPDDPQKLYSSVEPEGDKDSRTIFLSNLKFGAEEDSVFHTFGQVGDVHDIRFIRNPKGGGSVGSCYVEYVKADSVEKALKLDRQELDGRPVYVSKYAPNKDERENHYLGTPGEMERNRLFIRGLMPSVTKEELAQLFSKYAGLKDVRIVTKRNGQSKGFAFVEFSDTKTANQAVIEMDRHVIHGQPMEVAISAPPVKKPPVKGVRDPTGASKRMQPVSRPALPDGERRSRSNVMLLPRSIAKAAGVQAGQAGTSGPLTDTAAPAKSNSDFRALFTK